MKVPFQNPIKQEFAESLTTSIGAEDASIVLGALTDAPTVSVRFNSAKRSEAVPDWAQDGEPIDWCKQGIYLPYRPEFALDPNWHTGSYYVQEPASMIFTAITQRILELRDDANPGFILDLCAAPGGKTTAVLDALVSHDGWVMVANEVIYSRATVLRENLEKWGTPNVIVTNGPADGVCQVGEIFDVVITDVPCSGEGMMRKEQVARSQWDAGLVKQCAALQREIVTNAVAAVKPGGFLVYSTCTFNADENEENIAWIIREFGLEPLSLDIPLTAGIRGALPGYESLPIMRFFPGFTDSEGLTVCVLHKPEATYRARLKASALKPARLTLDWLKDTPDVYEDGGSIYALTKKAWPLRDALLKRAKILAGGTHVANTLLKGNKRIYEPTHSLVMSQLFDISSLPTLPLNETQALSYLRRETTGLPVIGSKGFQVPTYGGLSLGLVKNVGNRVNNLFPSGLRLRK